MKYKNHKDGEDGFTEWIKPNMDNYQMGCCDCGLVHTLQFDVEDDYVIFRAKRNERATGQKRRWKKYRKNK